MDIRWTGSFSGTRIAQSPPARRAAHSQRLAPEPTASAHHAPPRPPSRVVNIGPKLPVLGHDQTHDGRGLQIDQSRVPHRSGILRDDVDGGGEGDPGHEGAIVDDGDLSLGSHGQTAANRAGEWASATCLPPKVVSATLAEPTGSGNRT